MTLRTGLSLEERFLYESLKTLHGNLPVLLHSAVFGVNQLPKLSYKFGQVKMNLPKGLVGIFGPRRCIGDEKCSNSIRF